MVRSISSTSHRNAWSCRTASICCGTAGSRCSQSTKRIVSRNGATISAATTSHILKKSFPDTPVLALTATADEPTRRDIAERLHLGAARLFAAGYDRPNLFYRVVAKQNARDDLLRFLDDEHTEDAGIVYCLTRRAVEDTAAWLAQRGRAALPYHAGLTAETRVRHQDRFLREEGVIVVATVAFGMGIDKPNVRFVAHLDAPKNLEAYYQETGRAGRDGLPADAWMAYGIADVMNLRRL